MVERLAGACLYVDTWAHETTVQAKADFESLLQSTGSSGNRSAPGALGGFVPRFDEHGEGVMQIAMLCKALDL